MSDLTDAEVTEMLAKLRSHFRQPVMPISKYCEAITTWFRAIEAANEESDGEDPRRRSQGREYWEYLRCIEIDIRKSNLLYRILYCGEPLRKEKCPKHQGHWDGQAQLLLGCTYGCGGTGWLLLPEQKEARIVELTHRLKKTHEELVAMMQAPAPDQNPHQYHGFVEYRLACELLTLTGHIDLVPETSRG